MSRLETVLPRIPNYDVVDEASRHGSYVVHRARRQSDRQPVLLKTPLRVPPRESDIDTLRQEFELLTTLAGAGVPRAYELVYVSGGACLVLEDSGLWPLSRLFSAGSDAQEAGDAAASLDDRRSISAPRSFDLASFFRIGIQLCSILATLHRRKIVHTGICPDSVWVSRDGTTVQLLHVGVGLRIPPDAQSAGPDRAGAYMSPEQTGRTDRALDYRTDFYSLGATLYELLTGSPPFSSEDSLEIVHAHIAKEPTAPMLVGVPEQLSRIVLKLLAKAAEDRYQSATGIRRDLEACEQAWTASGTIPLFELGTRDVPQQIHIPQKLYGRGREVEALLNAFDETRGGRTALMLVSGYSGIGKTTLIHELYRPIARQRGYFVSGKFDQVVRSIPYGALTQALRGLVRQLLTQPEDQLSRGRTRLSQALGPNGGVLAEVLPEIELILGKQPPPAPLPATEARNRFAYVFQRFLATVAQKEHPLVVFLDDLHWVDAGTLDLLQDLLTNPDIRYLLVIGAYRDNEIGPEHPLARAIDRLKLSDVRVSELTLGPLAQRDLTTFLCDTLHVEPAYVEPLARLMQVKTDGNPFFVIQFIGTLEQEVLIEFDDARDGWSFRMDAIADAGMTDNVVDLMTRKIRRLSPEAQALLTVAACVGNRFDWNALLTVYRHSQESARAALSECLTAGLIQHVSHGSSTSGDPALSEDVYSFVHDRVQQAAYDLIPDAERRPVHLDLGRLLLAGDDLSATDDRIFAILNHLNIGGDLITDAEERLSVARLNLVGGRKAKASAAYRAACDYLDKGLALLDSSCWQSNYDLMFALALEAAECHYLAGAFEATEAYFGALLEHAASAFDEAQVHTLRITVYENQSRWDDALASGLAALAPFGIAFPMRAEDKVLALDHELDATQRALANRSIASLIDLPEMTDASARMAMRILTILWGPAYVAGGEVLACLISATMVRLSLVHGLTGDSAYGFVTHAMTIGPIRRDYQAAYQWGVLALNASKRFDDAKLRAKIHQQFQAHVNLWCRPFETCIPHAREACRSGLETGDFVYAGYGAATEAWSALLISRDLDRFVRDYAPTLGLLEKIKMADFRNAHRVLLNWAQALLGRTTEPLSLSDAAFDESTFVARYAQAPFFLTFVYAAKLHLSLMAERFADALQAARRAKDVAVTGTVWPVMIEFWGGLAAAAAYETVGEDEQRLILQQLAQADESLGGLADACPENFRSAWLLLSAERKRLAAQQDEAGSLLEDAAEYARQTDNLQHEAMANELAARLWLQRGQKAVAAAFVSEACRCYDTWGAAAKVTQLKERWHHLLKTPPLPSTNAPSLGATRTAEERHVLDMTTVLKVARAIAAEIQVDGLLRTLMKLALENAGAQRGIFLQDDHRGLTVKAEASIDVEEITVGQPIPLDRAMRLSHSIVRYVHRTNQDVVVADAASDERFADDPYIERAMPKSILCVPLAQPSSTGGSADAQGRLGGVLYLENNLTTGAFTPERVEMMRVLAGQTAISLEIARLYEETRSEVDRRVQAEHALRDALSQVEALKDRLQAENMYLQEEIRTEHHFNEIVGNSPALLDALRKVELVAPTDSTVLIAGETGCGKELFARAIHSRSRRSDRPLVKVNCGAIAPGLVESELFGHVKGAFTGAVEKRVGRFELAHGGTIFLDEISELPLDAQVKLLRVLQEQEFEPVGSSRTVRVSVRVIAATNRDLDRAVRKGKFRDDLLYRLNVFPIHVPSLRERKSDIGLLAGFFAAGLARKLGKPIKGFSPRSMERLLEYAWPGNVRELQNVVERAAIVSRGSILELEGALLGGESKEHGQSWAQRPEKLEDLERLHIVSVLKTTGGVVGGPKGAAALLGLRPNTLRSRMKKLGISARLSPSAPPH